MISLFYQLTLQIKQIIAKMLCTCCEQLLYNFYYSVQFLAKSQVSSDGGHVVTPTIYIVLVLY